MLIVSWRDWKDHDKLRMIRVSATGFETIIFPLRNGIAAFECHVLWWSSFGGVDCSLFRSYLYSMTRSYFCFELCSKQRRCGNRRQDLLLSTAGPYSMQTLDKLKKELWCSDHKLVWLSEGYTCWQRKAWHLVRSCSTCPQFLSFPLVSLVLIFVSFVHKDYWRYD